MEALSVYSHIDISCIVIFKIFVSYPGHPIFNGTES